MNSINLQELKRIQVDILRHIHNFCANNNIHYSLAYGTLLGAIRHKGYIPWDDDIDILMYRSDYDKFLKLFPGSIKYLELCAPEIDWNYYAPYANVWDTRTVMEEGHSDSNHRNHQMGIKVDIFPIDKASDRMLAKRFAKFLYLLWCSHRYRDLRKSSKGIVRIKSKCMDLLADIIGYTNIQKLIRRYALRLSCKLVDKVDLLVFYTNWSREFDIHDLDSYIDVDFEGEKFKSMVGYDDYLHCAFGDYMQLPPEEERIPRHNFKAYWKA